MIGLGVAGFLVIAALVLALLLDPHGAWPLGLVNLVVLPLVTVFGWAWQRFRLSPLPPPRWEWGWPLLERREKLLLSLGVLLTCAGGSIVLGELSNILATWWPVPAALARTFERLAKLDSPLEVLVPIMAVAALTEEGLFRGLLLPAFVQRYGSRGALALSALLFAAIHLNIWQGLPALAAGFYLGALRLRSGGLALPLAAHGLFNGLPVLLALSGLVITGYNDASAARLAASMPPAFLVLGAIILAGGIVLSLRFRLFRRPVF